MQIIFIVLIFMSLFSHSVWSRPVSYPGGYTAILANDHSQHSALIHYSPTAKYSIGLRSEYRREAKYLLTAVQMNNLLKRWNQKESQANLYLKSGLGYADRHSSRLGDDSSLAGFIGLAADWESRRYFLSYQNRYIEAGSVDDSYMESARFGIAPYIADYGALHTWLMVEIDHEPESEDTLTVTPLVRIFKDVYLLEAGISNHNDVLLNMTIRF